MPLAPAPTGRALTGGTGEDAALAEEEEAESSSTSLRRRLRQSLVALIPRKYHGSADRRGAYELARLVEGAPHPAEGRLALNLPLLGRG